MLNERSQSQKTIFIVRFPLYEMPGKGKARGTESSSFIVWDPH